MESFFNSQSYNQLLERLDSINPDDAPLWGKMTTAQMMNHCQEPLKIALGYNDKNLKSNWVVKLLFKKMLYSPKPFKKNAPTPPAFRSTGTFNFEEQKAELKKWMQELYNDRHNPNRAPHPVFGTFTEEQWGILQWKHLNHHFEQFGV